MAKNEEQKAAKRSSEPEQAEVTDKTTVMPPVVLPEEKKPEEDAAAEKTAEQSEDNPDDEGKKDKKDKKKKKQTIYTIKLIPDDDGDTKSIRLPARVLKFGIASVAAGALLFVGAFSYSVYSTFANQSGASEIRELRQVNNIQQEQLLQLSKKANALQDEIDQLTQLENDLRRMSGASPAQDSQDDGSGDGQGAVSGQHDGQGGPYPQAPSFDNVSETLDNVEKSIQKRRESLLALQQELKAQQEEMGLPNGAVSLPGSLVGSSVSVTTPTGWPARGEVSSPYGLRWNGSDFHPGIDIANDMGTPIVATADGTVVTAGWNSGGYGNMVDIDHGNGIMTRYGHAMQVVVSVGQHVRRGQIIAYMGSTGFSTGPHVHYEVRVNGQTVNPISYL
ncbi:peptidoglycan DD-metalloendopeptidase family protein [Mitsuokella sp.]|uniref:peptidoglycan DD-metalloendopeptidase family protein n=1 Tax=Mitsuokella sp. TaxID=2049034 RepID=UPI003D7C3866